KGRGRPRRAYDTTSVFPHFGHMTSIGRLLVVISIGEPQLRHVTVIGDVGGACTGSAFDGPAGACIGAFGPMPLNTPLRHIMRLMTIIQISMPITRIGTSPAVTNHRAFVPRIVTTSCAPAGEFDSVTWKTWSPSLISCG